MLKVPRAHHVILSELTVLQQENEENYQELMDFKGKILKLQEENKSWEVEWLGFISQISVLNANRREEEEVLKELMSQTLIHNEDQVNESPATELSIAMSQINLREGEIKELKEGNAKTKQELTKIIKERNKISSEKKHYYIWLKIPMTIFHE